MCVSCRRLTVSTSRASLLTQEEEEEDDGGGGPKNHEAQEEFECKRRKRLELNRKAAQESRRRKKLRIEELQRSVVFLTRENSEARRPTTQERVADSRRWVLRMGEIRVRVWVLWFLMEECAGKPQDTCARVRLNSPWTKSETGNVPEIREAETRRAHRAACRLGAGELREQNELLRQMLANELPVESTSTMDRFQAENAALKLVTRPRAPRVSLQTLARDFSARVERTRDHEREREREPLSRTFSFVRARAVDLSSSCVLCLRTDRRCTSRCRP